MTRLALLTLSFCLTGVAQNLPMFRGNLEHTGVYAGPGVRQFHQVKWQFKTNGPVAGSPTVAGGVVYAGSRDQNLYAIDRQSGQLKWKFGTDGAIASTPAVANGVVFLGSYDGYFYAVDAETGKLKWKFETQGERRFTHRSLHTLHPSGEAMPDPWDIYLSSPAVWNGAVYFGSGDGHIYALDAATGALKWKFRTGNVVHASPAIADGILVVGSWDGILYALEAESGKLKWKLQGGIDPQVGNQQGFQSSPAIVGGVVYVGCRDAIVRAIDLATGQQKWAFNNHGSWINTTPVVDEGVVVVASSIPSFVYGLDVKTGQKLFTIPAYFPVFGSPAVASGVAYVGTFGGKLHAIDLRTRETLWVFQTEASKHNAPAYSKPDGSIDFSKLQRANFYDEMVLAVGRLFSLGSFVASPVVDGETIYIGSTDGNVYALM